MGDYEDDYIESQVEQELEAISLSGEDLYDSDAEEKDAYDNTSAVTPTLSTDDDSTLLFLQRLSERNKVAQDILRDAEELLSKCNSARTNCEVTVKQTRISVDDIAADVAMVYSLNAEDKERAIKTVEEIEEENAIKLSDLEDRFKLDLQQEELILKQDQDAKEHRMKEWIENEQKIQTSLNVAIDKAQYWEKTYYLAAQSELAQREDDLQKEYLKSQRRILEIENEERSFLEDLLREKQEIETNKQEKAVKLIQAHFRGYRVRKLWGAEVRDKICKMKESRRLEKIAAIDMKRAKEKEAKLLQPREEVMLRKPGNAEIYRDASHNLSCHYSLSNKLCDKGNVKGIEETLSGEMRLNSDMECILQNKVTASDIVYQDGQCQNDHSTVEGKMCLAASSQEDGTFLGLPAQCESSGDKVTNTCHFGEAEHLKSFSPTIHNGTQVSGVNIMSEENTSLCITGAILRPNEIPQEKDTPIGLQAQKENSGGDVPDMLHDGETAHQENLSPIMVDDAQVSGVNNKHDENAGSITGAVLHQGDILSPSIKITQLDTCDDSPNSETIVEFKEMVLVPDTEGAIFPKSDVVISSEHSDPIGSDTQIVSMKKENSNVHYRKSVLPSMNGQKRAPQALSAVQENHVQDDIELTKSINMLEADTAAEPLISPQELKKSNHVEICPNGDANENGSIEESVSDVQKIDGNETLMLCSSKPSKVIINEDVQSTKSNFFDDAHLFDLATQSSNNIYKSSNYIWQIWFERFKMRKLTSNVKETSPSILKRRKTRRISSAAKQLTPLSHAEILNGAFTTSECCSNSKSSCLEDSKCVFLKNIQNGRNLSGVADCTYLSHLIVQNCGLLSLENLHSCHHLKYVDVSSNAINFLSCGGMRMLEYLDLSKNCISSIHGLESCESLLFLDLSHNNIIKIGGLEGVENLAHIRLSNNQLISMDGLRLCVNLVYLDVSENHLTSLEDLDDCGNLMAVSASGNNLEHLGKKFLDNAVLLNKLDVRRNNLSTLGMDHDCWLPLLLELYASINRINSMFQVDFSSTSPFLMELDLQKNLISEISDLKSLANCDWLQRVDLTENPVSKCGLENETFLRFIPQVVMRKDILPQKNLTKFTSIANKFCTLDNFRKKFSDITAVTENTEGIVNMVLEQLNSLYMEIKRHSSEMQRAIVKWNNNNEKNGRSEEKETCCPSMFSIHCQHLKRLQSVAVHFRRQYERIDGEPDEKDHEFEEKPVSELMDDKPKYAPQCHFYQSESENAQSITSTLEGKSDLPAMATIAMHRSNVYEKLNLAPQAGMLENVAAKIIQACWRGYLVRRRINLNNKLRTLAAIKLQAAWRGYITRANIQRAMDTLATNRADVLKHDEFENIDLGGFDFDEKSFDEQWAYRVIDFDGACSETGHLVTHSSSLFDHEKNFTQDACVSRPSNSESVSMCHSKEPLPPIPSRTNTPSDTRLALSDERLHSQCSSIMDSSRTKSSAKKDILSHEWGIKSSSTADLMMRRARRMKGRLKKNHTAEDKFHRFQDIAANFNRADLHSLKKQPLLNKVEYFKAREEEYRMSDKNTFEEDEEKMKYTYEWLHSQVGSNFVAPHKSSAKRKQRPQETQRTKSTGFLPHIPRSPSLVGAQDLEVVSLVSSNSYVEQRKKRLRDIVRRHNP